MKYVKLFETEAEFNEVYNSDEYLEPWTSYIRENERSNFNKSEREKLLGTPLTFEITSDGEIKWKAQNTAYTSTIEYSKNDGEWTSITSNTGDSAPMISVVSGDTVQFRGDNASYSSGESRYNYFSGTTCGFNVKGNIMSLINSTGFSTATTFQTGYSFCYLFQDCAGLIDASKLILPATTLREYCYSHMFQGCISLTTAPELPATASVAWCYSNMFSGCTGLTTAPALPATRITQGCYNCMFAGCACLTRAPELPATTLEYAMSCYSSMFQNCTGLTTAPELPATTLAQSCYNYMFRGCTSLTTAPELPATTLLGTCYRGMFSGCTNINYIKCLATDISAGSCTYGWVQGVANSGTFIKDANADWTVKTGNDGIPTNWTVQDA